MRKSLIIDAGGSVLNPPLARSLMAQLALELGYISDVENVLWALMHPDQYASWEACAIPVQSISLESSPRTSRRTFMGLTVELPNSMAPTVIQIRKKSGELVAEINNLHVMETVNA